MEESLMDRKIEVNSAIKLKDVTVLLERLSDATIFQYTGKSINTGSESEKDIADRRKLIARFCTFCNEGAPAGKDEKISLKKSCQKCGTDLNYKCLKCKIEYKHYKSIYMHITRKCGSVTRYSCSFCDYVTTVKTTLWKHIARLHSDTSTVVRCKQCGAQCKNSYSLSSHLRYCGKAPDLFCSFCNFKTVYRSNLRRHLQKHSSDESQSTSQTDKSIPNNTKVAHLIIRHCRQCDELIEFSGFVGNRICPKCKSKWSFQCAKCGLESNIYRSILYHIETKCGARESQCPRCDKMFPSAPKQQSHLSHCRKKFACEVCPIETKYKYKLSSQDSKQKMNDEGTMASKNNIPTTDSNNVDLGIVKVEKDTRLSDYIETPYETQFKAVSDSPIVKQESYIKEELMLSMSECSDNEGGDEFVALKRKYHDVDDQLVLNASKKFKMD